jgi:arginase
MRVTEQERSHRRHKGTDDREMDGRHERMPVGEARMNRFILSPSFLDQAVPGLKSLAKSNWLINSPVLSEGSQQSRMSTIHQSLADIVAKAIASGKRPVSIAGDCCTAIGVLSGLQHAGINPSLIWFDAHGDFNTWETSPSGFLGGMPLAMIVGRGDQTLAAAVDLKPLPEDQAILTDGRDLDPAERAAVDQSAVVHLAQVADLLEYTLPAGPIYVHFDTDVVSLHESPAHNYPAAGGPPASVMQSVFNRLAQSGQVAAVSLSAWNPDLDKDKRSEDVSMALLHTLIG